MFSDKKKERERKKQNGFPLSATCTSLKLFQNPSSFFQFLSLSPQFIALAVLHLKPCWVCAPGADSLTSIKILLGFGSSHGRLTKIEPDIKYSNRKGSSETVTANTNQLFRGNKAGDFWFWTLVVLLCLIILWKHLGRKGRISFKDSRHFSISCGDAACPAWTILPLAVGPSGPHSELAFHNVQCAASATQSLYNCQWKSNISQLFVGMSPLRYESPKKQFWSSWRGLGEEGWWWWQGVG